MSEWVRISDAVILVLMTPLAIYLAISGVDDLFVDVAWLTLWIEDRLRSFRTIVLDSSAVERRIAIFVPLWRESAVIEQMLSHNIAALHYGHYTFFCGAYPNDEPTLDAIRDMEARSDRVQLAVCPHDGPTSKADCLNWIYQRMLDYERRTGERFDLIVTHDAEDILHPESLRWFNHLAVDYDFIQIPVLALRTPLAAFTHGIYCDEFAEFQTRDLRVRNQLGGFVPSAGVGTGYSRRALEALARTRENQVFDPVCLTEDYENGLRLHELGFRQVFVPPTHAGESWVATREYFPRSFRAAVRQRTRWVTGISLQSWDMHGWSGNWQQKYWLWRDRKGLIGSPLSLLTNALTVYALASGLWDRVTPPRYVVQIFALTVLLQILRIAVRATCSARVYGWKFAALSPVRAVWGNVINAVATVNAMATFSWAQMRGRELRWLKTSHEFPAPVALLGQRRKLGQILVASGALSQPELDRALATQPHWMRIGEWLVATRTVTPAQVYDALSVQQGIPMTLPAVSRRAARALPAHVQREWHVLPCQIAAGKMMVASSEAPSPKLNEQLREYTKLEVRFHLVTPRQMEQMRRAVG